MFRRHGTRLAIAILVESSAMVLLARQVERRTDRLEERGRLLVRRTG